MGVKSDFCHRRENPPPEVKMQITNPEKALQRTNQSQTVTQT
jgi:hypothetical protein